MSEPIISVDYTDLFRHRSRSYTFDTIRIGPGLDWLGFGWGLGFGAAVAAGLGTLLWAIELPWLPWWLGLAACVATIGVVYAIVTSDAGSSWSSSVATSTGLVLAVIELSWLPWWVGMLLGVLTTIVVYVLVSKDSRGNVSPVEQLFLAIDYTFRQPTRIQGLGSDDAPTELHWQAILWNPEWMSSSTTDFTPPAQYGVRTKGH